MVFVLAAALAAACSNALPPQAIPVAPPPRLPIAPTEQRQLVFAVDDLGTGFNPHLISDLSPVTEGVASLVLPSVFRPAPDGSLTLDNTVATSAKVVSTAPFTVSYELSLAASWSDNTPIAAEDFVYLWERMRREPGVVDAAGYQLITDVRSRAGGKAVDVVFARAYPQWQRLFSNLLPASLLRNAPRGWRAALTDAIPVSGGPFQLTAVDRDRGQLVLSRNDHYWATPAVLDSLVLRRLEPSAMLDGLRAGELPLVQAWPDDPWLVALRQLSTPVPGRAPGHRVSVRLQPVAQPVVVSLGMRTDSGVFADDKVRHAIGGLLNRDALIAVGTGNGAGGVRVDAQLLAPSTPGYRPTMPPGAPGKPDPKQAEQLLTAAGYHRDQAGNWVSATGPLRVVIGVPAQRDRYAAVAEETRRQLVAAGVDAQVVTAAGTTLYTEPTVPPAAVSPSPSPSLSPSPAAPVPSPAVGAGPGPPPGAAVGGSAGDTVGSSAGGTVGSSAGPVMVPPVDAATPTVQPPAPSSTTPPPAPGPVGTRVDMLVLPRAVGSDLAGEAQSSFGCPPGMAGVDQPARNSTGYCSAALQPVLDAALAGGLSADQVAASVEPVLWRELPTIPLFQVVTTLVSTPAGDHATGGIGPGPLLLGPLSSAAAWHPTTG